MNHYAKILTLLEALPEDQHMLMSGVRRGLVLDTAQPCGCLFGSLVPSSVSGDGRDLTRTFSGASYGGSPLRRWWAEAVGEVPTDFRHTIDELEYTNDNYMNNDNSQAVCVARYAFMCDYLRKRAKEQANVE